jgi:hypothetical protein
MHCGGGGQVNCGENPARRAVASFKRAFEIDWARKTANINYY